MGGPIHVASSPATMGSAIPSQAVAMDAAGAFVISWVGQTGVNAQRYNALGVQQGSTSKISTTSADGAAVAVDAAGDFVVTWYTLGFFGGGNLTAQAIQPLAGVAQGGKITVTTNAQLQDEVAMDAAGDFVVTWQSYGSLMFTKNSFLRRYNAAGVALGSAFQVTNSTADQENPVVAMDAEGDFVVTLDGAGPAHFCSSTAQMEASKVFQ